jgi:RNA polymerase sigma-70 factor (ECF subfamily)
MNNPGLKARILDTCTRIDVEFMDVPGPPNESPFPTTLWSQILPGPGGDGRSRAFEALARRYEGPIRSYLRAALKGGAREADDLAQEFFAWVIESRFLEKADPARGRFRGFLKVSLRRFAADARRKAGARKRGGDRTIVSLDGVEPHSLPITDPGARSPEAVLDEEWRAALVAQALERTESELRAAGRDVVFAVFRDYFLEATSEIDYRAVAARHGVSVVDVSNHLARAKKIFRSKLRDLVLDSVHGPGDLEDELRWLLEEGGR